MFYVPDELIGRFYLLAGVLGAIFGSFVNALAWRIPNGISIADGRSRCPQCHAQLYWYHNIPIVSYLVLRGRCGHCGKPIAIRYLLVELFMAGAFVLNAWMFPELLLFLRASFLVTILVLLSAIDLEHMILPDVVSLPAAGFMLGLTFMPWSPVAWREALIAGGGGFAMFWAIGALFKWLRGIDGLGFGDVKLMLLVGFSVGLRGLLLTIILGSLSGLVVGGITVLRAGGNAQTRFPFGPFLALGCLLALWFAPWLEPVFFPSLNS